MNTTLVKNMNSKYEYMDPKFTYGNLNKSAISGINTSFGGDCKLDLTLEHD